MNQTNIKIGQLRDRMKELGIDAYLVPTADFHDMTINWTWLHVLQRSHSLHLNLAEFLLNKSCV